MVRRLADLSRWLQRHARTATDLNEQRVEAFLQDRDRRDHTHCHDRPVLRRLLGPRREPEVIAVPVVETNARACEIASRATFSPPGCTSAAWRQRPCATTATPSGAFSVSGWAVNRSDWRRSAPTTARPAWCLRRAGLAPLTPR